MKVGTIWRTRDIGMRYGGVPPEPALLESEPSRRIKVMRLGTGAPEQIAWPPALCADGHPETQTTIQP